MTPKKEHSLTMFEEGVLWAVFGCMKESGSCFASCIAARLTAVYWCDEIKEDEKVTTCDTCLRE